MPSGWAWGGSGDDEVDLRRLLRTLVRRWFVVVAVWALGALVGMQIVTVRPVYEAHGTVLLLPPTVQRPNNVYREFTDALIGTADVLGRRVTDGETRAAMGAAGYAFYDVTLTNRGTQWVPLYDQPTLVVTSRDHNPGRAQRTMAAVVARIQRELAARQQREAVAPNQVIDTSLVGATRWAVQLHGNRKRALASLALLTFGASVVAGLGVERLARRRRVRRSGRLGHLGPARAASALTSATTPS